ncbi:unnamed protein product [Acanthoscelides obtectus]|uniref:Uncharacterized protein n=1 Tax=Acanthoscelides obtectus TaxID=200917 RepID=A0A9P0KME6_ACAOB|nr:unnamed protein product [Acanthoscelides obtectus]CAK1627851.1 Solute carrier organic anion transporter family member 3A1 [Acanthoscelides obtectus]
MVRPSDIIWNVVAPAGNYLNDVDCGFRILPSKVSNWLKLQRLVRLGYFVIVLAMLGFVHGVLLNYVRGTAELWGEHYDMPKNVVGWFIYAGEVQGGIFAFAVAYWGSRTHRACWIGGLTIFLALAAATLAIPEIYKPYNATEIDRAITALTFCSKNTSRVIEIQVKRNFTIDMNTVMAHLFQLAMGLASVAYYSLGVTYIDDHVTPQHTPGYIGVVIAAKSVGNQVGIYSAWCPYVLRRNIFGTVVWFWMIAFTLLFGLVIILFPKELPQFARERSVDSLVTEVTGRNPNPNQEDLVDGFFKSIRRILKNKFLLLNLLAYTLIQTALINFRLFENGFNQSKYHSTLHPFATSFNGLDRDQFTSQLLEQPMVAVFSMTTGLVMAKIKPRAKELVTSNIIIFLLIGMMFSMTVFWECVDDHEVKILGNATYVRIIDTSMNEHNCKLVQSMGQVHNVIITGLMASVFMSNTMLNMKSVDSKDTSLAIGLQFTFVGIIPYLIVRSIYYFTAEVLFCLIHGANGCEYYSEGLARFLSAVTVLLIFLAALVSGVVLFSLHDIQLYRRKKYCDSRDIDIVHLTLASSLEGDSGSTVEIFNGPAYQLRDMMRDIHQVQIHEVNKPNEEPEPTAIFEMCKVKPRPSTSQTQETQVHQNEDEITIEEILDTLRELDSEYEDESDEDPEKIDKKHEDDDDVIEEESKC